MELETVQIDLDTETPTVVLHEEDALELGIHPMDRVQLRHDDGTATGVVKVTTGLVAAGHIGVTHPLTHLPERVAVQPAPQPQSLRYIRRKLQDVELDRSEIRTIVQDLYHDRLTDVELSAYIAGVYANGMSLGETIHMTESMADVGDRIEWGEPVVADKHSIGGIPGNRTTPIVVAIVAAAGVKITKTSSRGITSPAGTADTMEVFCDVELNADEIRRVVGETNGCLVWGGAIELSPVDDRIIRVLTPLSLDPEGQVIASVLSKKRSAGSSHVVIDIPYGEAAKVTSHTEARKLARDFKRVGERLDMRIRCAITRGDGPIGRGIGPAHEARDVLEVLQGAGPPDLRSKGVRLASILLAECDVDADAEEILESGRALETFRSIVGAQRGDPDVSVDDIRVGKHTRTLTAGRDGVVAHVDNSVVSELARRAGAPKDRAAGLQMHTGVGKDIASGDPMVTIYADSEPKLEDAIALSERADVLRILHPEETLIEQL